MANEALLDLERVRERLSYEPITGQFRWKKVPGRGGGIQVEFAGYKEQHGYIVIRLFGGLYRAHRLAWWLLNGSIPDGFEIDHIDGRRDNNALANLRLASRSQNNCNAKTWAASGYKGVSWDTYTDNWQAYIKVAGRKKNLGRYDRAEDAARARDAAAIEHFGEFARLNFPEGI